MSLVINSKETMESKAHYFGDYIAFLDSDGDFWLVDEDNEYVSRLTERGCGCERISDYDTIEDFLYRRFGCGLVKAFNGIDDFKITVEC